MSNVVLTSVHDNLVDYVLAHGLNPNVVVPLINQAAAEAIAGWGVTGVVVSTTAEAPFDEAQTIQLAAAVQGTGEYTQNVTWSISGNKVVGTTISSTGLLTLAAGEFLTGETPVVEHDITVTATSVDNNGVSGTYVVTCVTPSVSLTYDANGGTEEQVDLSSPYTKGVTVTTAVGTTFVAPEGKAFDRWAWNADGTGDVVPATFEITANTVIYALWKNIYTITYDANGGTGEMTDTSNPYDAGEEVTVAANAFASPPDATFVKWNTAADGSGTDYAPTETFDIGEDTTLYAIWQYAIVEGTLLPDTQLYVEAFSSEDATFAASRGEDTSITLTFTEWKLDAGAVDDGTVFTLELAYPVVPAMYVIGAPYTAGDGFEVTLDAKYTNTTFNVRNPSALVLNGVVNVGGFRVAP